MTTSVLAFSIGCPFSAEAQSLRQALESVYGTNPGLHAERERQRADEAGIKIERANIRPSVGVDAYRGKSLNGANPGQSNDLTQDGYGVSLVQPLFQGMRGVNGIRRAKAEAAAGAADLYGREQTTFLDAVEAYMNVLRDRRIARLRADNVRFLKNEVSATIKRRDAGESTKTDVSQARTRLFEGEADLVQAKADKAASEAIFKSVIGNQPGHLSMPPVPGRLLPRTLGAALDAADVQYPDVVSAEHLIEAASRARKVAYGEHLPTASLELRHGVDHQTSVIIDREESSSVFVRLTMPLYSGGATRGRIEQARARESRAQFELSDRRRRAQARVIETWNQYHAARTNISAVKKRVASAQESLEGVRREVKEGERSLFELLDAQRELIGARVALVRAQRDHVVTAYRLLEATGHLTAGNLNLQMAALKPPKGSDVAVGPARRGPLSRTISWITSSNSLHGARIATRRPKEKEDWLPASWK